MTKIVFPAMLFGTLVAFTSFTAFTLGVPLGEQQQGKARVLYKRVYGRSTCIRSIGSVDSFLGHPIYNWKKRKIDRSTKFCRSVVSFRPAKKRFFFSQNVKIIQMS